jgi:site-specific DNA recombinase
VSGVSAIIRNVRYTGKFRWNTTEWLKDPDTGNRRRLERPRTEWQEHFDDSLQIISESDFEKAQRRTRDRSNSYARLKSGGRPKYLLSGLLRCGKCGAHYILNSVSAYACSGYLGGDCSNSERVRRDHVEKIILDPIRNELLSADRVERMAHEMRSQFEEMVRQKNQRAEAVPAELKAISERIARLQDRRCKGDPDLEPDEIQAAIDLAEQKRRELEEAQPDAKESAKMIAMLPNAAKEYRRQITLGLDQDARAANKARTFLRKLLGPIELCPGPDKSLWARYEICPAALLKAGAAGASTDGSGGVVCAVPTVTRRIRLK